MSLIAGRFGRFSYLAGRDLPLSLQRMLNQIRHTAPGISVRATCYPHIVASQDKPL